MSQNKRLRAPNYTTAECITLCAIVDKYKNIIENKTTDGACLAEKQAAWKKIAEQYNASGPNHYRSVESLQNCYKKLKQKTKKEHAAAKMNVPVNKEKLIIAVEENGENWDAVANDVQIPKEDCQSAFNSLIKAAIKNEADIKKSVMGTGGGPPSNDHDVLLDKVKGLMKGIEGMYTVHDGDSELMAECSAAMPIDSICTDKITVPYDEPTQKSSELFTTKRPNLKRKKDPALKGSETPKTPKHRATVLGNFAELADRKINLVNVQQELLSLQLEEEKEKILHNNAMRQLEIQAIKMKYKQEENLREEQLKLLRLEVLLKEKQLS